MKPIGEWKNVYLRRIAIIPAAPLSYIMFLGASLIDSHREYMEFGVPLIKRAWRE